MTFIPTTESETLSIAYVIALFLEILISSLIIFLGSQKMILHVININSLIFSLIKLIARKSQVIVRQPI